jgi:hypothetical protein
MFYFWIQYKNNIFSSNECFYVLNHIVQAHATLVDGLISSNDFTKNNNHIFGVGTIIEESLCALFVGELHLFMKLFIVPIVCVNPLFWWHNHDIQFPKHWFFCQTNPRNSKVTCIIKIEHVFNLASVLIYLWHCHLQTKKLDHIIIMVKNQHNSLFELYTQTNLINFIWKLKIH